MPSHSSSRGMSASAPRWSVARLFVGVFAAVVFTVLYLQQAGMPANDVPLLVAPPASSTNALPVDMPESTQVDATVAAAAAAAAHQSDTDDHISATCDFTSNGFWRISRKSADDVESTPLDGGALRTPDELFDAQWVPKSTRATGCNPAMPPLVHRYKTFDKASAQQCLAGKTVVLYGNSNTRTLYTALEALLKGTKQMSRLAAKQLCDNSKRNHSCWMTIPTAAGGDVRLFYWGYIDELFDTSLLQKLQPHFAEADVLIGNAGINRIQATSSNSQWVRTHEATGPRIVTELLPRFTKPGFRFFWHTTTPLCPHQSHFKRYKYQKRAWAGRSLEETNAAIALSNKIAVRSLLHNGNRGGVTIIDDAALMNASHSVVYASSDVPRGSLCRLYDDPLHHRFLDREVVQLFLNYYCAGPPGR